MILVLILNFDFLIFTKHQDHNKDVAHKHSRAPDETQKINSELEKQFNEGIHSKQLRAHHLGLGFGDEKVKSRKPNNNSHIKFDDDDDDDANEKAGKETTTKTTTTTTTTVKKKKEEEVEVKEAPKQQQQQQSRVDDPKAKFKKMVFVKSSS